MTSSYYEKIGDDVRCIDEEIPFELPGSWEWVRMKNMMQVIGGVTYDKNDVSEAGIRILRGGNILADNTIAFFADDVFLPVTYENKANQVYVGDIVVVASTGSTAVIGKPAFIDREMPQTQIGGFLRIVRPTNSTIAEWLPIIFQSDYYRSTIASLAKGTNINNVKAGHLEEFLLPVPTTNELKVVANCVSAIATKINPIVKMLQ